MNATHRVRILAALLASTLIVSGHRAAAADKLDDLIQTLATVTVPEKCPPGASAVAWKRDRHKEWARYRLEAQKTLTAAGAKAIPRLLTLIKKTNHNLVKCLALAALDQMSDRAALRRAAPTLLGLLGTREKPQKHAGVRYVVLSILGKVGYQTDAALKRLHEIAQAKEEEDIVRLQVADVLGRLGHRTSVAPLLSLLAYGAGDKAEDNPGHAETPYEARKAVRLHAARALGRLGVALESIPRLALKLDLEDINERNAAVDAITELLGYDIREGGQWPFARTSTQRAPIIKTFNDWWAATVKKARDNPLDKDAELSLRMNISADKKQLLPAQLNAIRTIQRLGHKEIVINLVPLMFVRNREMQKAWAETATKLSGRELVYRPEDKFEDWITKVNEFSDHLK